MGLSSPRKRSTTGPTGTGSDWTCVRPGKPTDNAHIEAVGGSLRRECLSQHWFLDLDDAREILSRWREDYNNIRPHSSLGHLPPAHFRAGGAFTPAPERLENLPV